MPEVANLGQQTLYGKSHSGFLKSCINFLVNTTKGLKVAMTHCLTKPATDWQMAVLALNGCAGLSCTVGQILVVLNMANARFQDKIGTKIGIAVTTAVSSLMIAVLITLELNMKNALKLDGTYVQADYHLQWSFYIYCAGSILYGILHLVLLVGICISKRYL
ncbi:hypothetical protein RRG08_028119 [Elysia crispata]|uniref:Uncharacterized protein n=1 Tax=Elysia crispata TaxID=231223 RepID=A0AAE1A563_9GAST|nr:hypothetical protein RRG08_028119 [Elysia crispata]